MWPQETSPIVWCKAYSRHLEPLSSASITSVKGDRRTDTTFRQQIPRVITFCGQNLTLDLLFTENVEFCDKIFLVFGLQAYFFICSCSYFVSGHAASTSPHQCSDLLPGLTLAKIKFLTTAELFLNISAGVMIDFSNTPKLITQRII